MKKIIKIFISLLVITLIILLGILFNKTSNINKIKEEIYNTENESLLKENITKIEELPNGYSFEEAVNDKCVVSTTKLYNKNKLESFIENINNNVPDFIRIVNYTVEGDMIITDIQFEKNNVFKVCVDGTRDKFASEQDRTYKYMAYKKLGIEKTENQTIIYLDYPVEEENEKMYVLVYDNNIQTVNNY